MKREDSNFYFMNNLKLKYFNGARLLSQHFTEISKVEPFDVVVTKVS